MSKDVARIVSISKPDQDKRQTVVLDNQMTLELEDFEMKSCNKWFTHPIGKQIKYSFREEDNLLTKLEPINQTRPEKLD